MKSLLAMLVIFIFMVGCTSVNVKPVDPALKLSHICIEENPKVRVDDFVEVLRDGFDRHGITTNVFSGNTPPGCEYLLTYTALRNWDLAPYMYYAELWIKKDGKEVASAEYHLVGKGGLSLAKFQGTRTKMDPIIDELLQSYQRTSREEDKQVGEGK